MGAAIIETEVFAELPARLRKSGTPPERLAAGKSSTPMGSFLEGPSFDRDGNLYVVDLAWGRIFRVDETGEFHVVIEYDGEPNGLAIHKDGRIFVADHKHGILRLENGKMVPVVSRYHQETFKGVNDLTFDPQGNLYFTDQGVTDLADPTGCVYCYTAAGKLVRLANCIPSPNGLVFSENLLYVAATRANAVWRLPLAPDGTVVRLGVFLHLSGGRGPDGVAMDQAGGLAVAHIDFGAVWIFSHRGEPLYRVQSCTTDMVTNVAYKGNELYITDSGSGAILRARADCRTHALLASLSRHAVCKSACMKTTTILTIAAALALGAAGCDTDTPTSAQTQPQAGAGGSAPRESSTPSTPANLPPPQSQAEKRESSNPVQQQVDPKQDEQQRDFRMKGG